MWVRWWGPEVRRAEMARRWREWVPRVVRAIKKLYPDAEVYLIGSVAEGLYTGASDVDLLVATSNPRRRLGRGPA